MGEAGTTSACAENTCDGMKIPTIFWNYLRVRGEYDESDQVHIDYLELPPRARRILAFQIKGLKVIGTTSACAENTYSNASQAGLIMELPPRARRIPGFLASIRENDGTTSACAENTPVLRFIPRKLRNYLRVRGEYGGLAVCARCCMRYKLPHRRS